MLHLLQWERVGTWGKWNMDRQHCLCLDSLSVQTWPFWYCILFLFLPRWVMSIEIKKNRREDGDLSLIICTGLPLSPLHIVTQCAATFTVRVYQIRCYFTSVSWYNFQSLQGTAKWCRLSELYVFSPSPLPAPVACW